MNLSTLFFDKLSRTDSNLATNNGKKSIDANFFFQDLIKIIESSNEALSDSVNISTQNFEEILSPQEKVVTLNNVDFINVENQIDSLVTNNNIETEEQNYKLQDAEISKLHFILDANNLFPLLKSFIENNNLNFNEQVNELSINDNSITLTFKNDLNKISIAIKPIKLNDKINLEKNSDLLIASKILTDKVFVKNDTLDKSDDKLLVDNTGNSNSSVKIVNAENDFSESSITEEKVNSVKLDYKNSTQIVIGNLSTQDESSESDKSYYKIEVLKIKSISNYSETQNNYLANSKTKLVNNNYFSNVSVNDKPIHNDIELKKEDEKINNFNRTENFSEKKLNIQDLLNGLTEEEKSVFKNFNDANEIKRIEYSFSKIDSKAKDFISQSESIYDINTNVVNENKNENKNEVIDINNKVISFNEKEQLTQETKTTFEKNIDRNTVNTINKNEKVQFEYLTNQISNQKISAEKEVNNKLSNHTFEKENIQSKEIVEESDIQILNAKAEVKTNIKLAEMSESIEKITTAKKETPVNEKINISLQKDDVTEIVDNNRNQVELKTKSDESEKVNFNKTSIFKNEDEILLTTKISSAINIKKVKTNGLKENEVNISENENINELKKEFVAKEEVSAKNVNSNSEIKTKQNQLTEVNLLNNNKNEKELTPTSDDKKNITKQIDDNLKQVKVKSSETKENKLTSLSNNSSNENKNSSHTENNSYKNEIAQVNLINNDLDKIKQSYETKLFYESTKTLKQEEIISEFSRFIQQGEKQSISFQLTPENLGKVKLVVDLVDDIITTKIEVENEQIKQFIQSNIEQLKNNLQSSGIQLTNINISLADYSQKQNQKIINEKKKYNSRIENEENLKTEKEPKIKKNLGYNTYEYLA